MKPKITIKSVHFMFLAVSLAATALLIWSCRSEKPTAREKVRQVILISIDTCRADYLSCYGFDRKTTPNIDAFAQQAILFEQAVTPVPLTLPAHTSMLCGTIPAYHGVHDNVEYKVSPANESLAEIFQQNGYKTAAIIAAFVLDSQFGLDQGFDSYDDEFEDEHSYRQISERRGDETTRLANQWLDQHGQEDFFLFLHYYDPHADYRPPPPFDEEFKDDLYAGEIAYTDQCIGSVLDKLRQLQIYDSAMIVIVGDHGEGLGQHAENEHSFFIYQSTMHVPLIIKPPFSSQSQRVKDYVGIIDIAPTILGMTGLKNTDAMQGLDLFQLLAEKNQNRSSRFFLCESFYPDKYGCNPLLGIVGADYKYIQAPRPELYHLRDDPGELNNLAPAQTDLARKYRSRLGKLLNEQIRPEKKDNKLKLDTKSIRRLESLGYVAGSVDDTYDFDPDKLDAKDFIDYHRLSHEFSLAMDNRNFQDARQICVKMTELYPNVTNIHYKFGLVALKQGRLDESIRHHEILLEHFHRNAKAHAQMGEALIRAGRSEQARHHLEKALELNSDDDAARGNLGVALNQLERFSEAVEHFRRVLQNEPQNAHTLSGLALALSRQNQWEEAVRHFRIALELEPNDWEMHTNLGQTLAKLGQAEKAMAHWHKALEVSKNNDQAQVLVRNLMALLSAQQGKIDQAIIWWQEMLEISPDNVRALENLAQAYARKGDINQALSHWTKLIELDEDNIVALYNLGKVASKHRDLASALEKYSRVLELQPEHMGTLNDLAWLLATCGSQEICDPDRAVLLAEKACQLDNYQNPATLDTLAAAYAAKGKFSQALETAQKAMDKARSSGNKKLAEQIKARLLLYQSNQPYHE